MVELLVVIAIIGTLTLMGAGFVSQAVERAEDVKCVANLRTILTGALTFATDRNGKLWTRTEVGYSKYRQVDDPLGLPMLLKDYVPDKKTWLCPCGRKSLDKFGNNYTWSAVKAFEDQAILTLDPKTTLVVWDAYNYSLPSLFNASDDFKGDGTSVTGPSALPIKYQQKPHFGNTAVNWGFLDGHVISGANAAQ